MFGRTKKSSIFVRQTTKNFKTMEQVSYMMNDLEIIGAMGQNIYVRSQVSHFNDETKDFTFEWVCLVFSMTSYINMQKEYIKNKKKICEMYNEFCGWSDITSDCVVIGSVDMRIETEDINEIVEVRALRPKNFQVCMEHG
jgi:hypothetical protein